MLIVLLGGSSVALAQQSIEFGSIGGRVLDPTGAPVPDTTVTVRHLDTGIIVTTASDTEGRFRVSSLRVGAYAMTASHPGFQDFSRRMVVNAGGAFDVTVSLTLAGVDTLVTVSADLPPLDTARSQIAGTVSIGEIRSLPSNGRQFLDLALILPGVAPANVGSSQLFPETSAVPGISLSVNGQRNLSNNVLLDGLSANDDAAGLSGITVAMDAIEQLQVVTSGGQAEFGRALGGYINIVTRSGTNARQGSAYYFGRDDRLNARNPLSPVRLPMRQHQYGASAGGPVIAGRTFYFGNIEQRRLDSSGAVTIAPEAAAAINARLDAVQFAGPRVATGVYRSGIDSTNLLAKLTHAIDTRSRLAIKYAMYDVGADNARGAGGLNATSAASGLDNRDHSLAATHTLALTSLTIIESRGQVAHGDLRAEPSDSVGPAVTIAGTALFGRLSTSPTGRMNTMLQAATSLTHQAGAHAVRAGVDILDNYDRIVFPRAVRGSYTFGSLPAFLAGTYNNGGFTQTFGATEVAQRNPNIGVYLQDEWHVHPGVTINAGLRYDLQFLETIALDSDNVSPRIGIAWAPGGSGRTVIRGSAGLFYDRVPLRALANALLSADNSTDVTRLRQVAVTVSPSQAGAPSFPGVLAEAVPSVTPVNLTTMDPRLQNAYSRQASAEIERQLRNGTSVSAGYEYVRGVGLLMTINQNVPTCVASGTNNGCRPNPAYANNNQYTAAGRSAYHGLRLSWLQEPAHWGSYRVSYTLSRSMNDVGEFFFSSPIDPADPSSDWARADGDQRHRLVVSGTLQLPTAGRAGGWFRHLQVSGVLQAYSSPPFTVTTGLTTIQGTAARPIVDGRFIPRNAGEGTPYVNLSLRVGRTFALGDLRRLEILVEGFNLTNHRNVLTRNGTFGTGAYPADPLPSFAQVTAVNEMRGLQLGARLQF